MIFEAIVKATPLLFCALSFLLAWRAGILNIGAEGQFLVGALAAAAVATRIAAPGALLALLALAGGAAAGGLWAGLAAWLLAKRSVLEVLSTILLNFVAAGLVSISVHGFLQERARTFPQSDAILESARLPLLVGGSRLHSGILIGVAVALLLSTFLRRTRAGFRLRAAGAGPRAAMFAGIPVVRVRTLAFLVSGAIAGLGGAVELLGVTGRLFESFSEGAGYLGLAVAVVGGLSPRGSLAAALAFGILNVAGSLAQRRYAISSVAAIVVEAVLLLGALAAARAFPGRPRAS